MIGGADHGFLVFDDHERVALVAQAAHHLDEAAEVARVKADRRLIEDEERVDQRGAEASGEIHALDLAAGKRARGAVEREVAKADLDEIAQARGDRSPWAIAPVGSSGGGSAAKMRRRITQREHRKLREREAGRRRGSRMMGRGS